MLTQLADIAAAETRTLPSSPAATLASTPPQDPVTPVVKRESIATSLVFQVDSVEKTETPGTEQGQDWYRYVLKNHSSTINGLRRGSRQHVCDYAAQYAEQLNTRIVHGPTPWSPRGGKTTPRSR